MSRIKKAFEKGKAFIGFVTAGDPSLNKTEEFILAMDKAGADIIEIGIPFSDPVAEGMVIQKANIRALAVGTTTEKVFEMVKSARKTTQKPLVFLTYLNPVYTYGYERFFSRCSDCGIDGIIIPDLPFEEKNELLPYCEKYGVDLISLIAPTSVDRITMIASQAQGFVYCVSSMGVTGVRSEIKTNLEEIINAIRTATDIPVAVGFGISTPEQAAQISRYADGVIVGSAIVKIVEQYGENATIPIQKYIRDMKASLR